VFELVVQREVDGLVVVRYLAVTADHQVGWVGPVEEGRERCRVDSRLEWLLTMVDSTSCNMTSRQRTIPGHTIPKFSQY
jgi:hypothetical protein